LLLNLLVGAVFSPNSFSATTAAGELRVLKLRFHEINHPHRDVAGEFRLLSDFARDAGLTIRWLDAVQSLELEQRLARGEGDLMVADRVPHNDTTATTMDGLGMGQFDYVVSGNSESEASDPSQLSGLRVAVSLASPMWSYLTALERADNGPALVVLPDHYNRQQILAGIEAGRYDAAVVSSRTNEQLLVDHRTLKRLFVLSGNNTAMWKFAPAREQLRDQFNSYLRRYHATVAAPPAAFGDLEKKIGRASCRERG